MIDVKRDLCDELHQCSHRQVTVMDVVQNASQPTSFRKAYIQTLDTVAKNLVESIPRGYGAFADIIQLLPTSPNDTRMEER